MFKRIIHEQWTAVVPVVSFILTAAVFMFFSIRALLMRKKDTCRLSSLPINEAGNHPSHDHER